MIRKKTISFCVTLLIFATLIGAVRFYNGDFRLGNIDYHWHHAHKWTTNPPSDEQISEIQALMSQKFNYLGKGNQTYAFVSEDGDYVLKFFKFGHLKPPEWLEWLPNFSFVEKYKQSKLSSQHKRLNNNFQGHWIAATYDSENCGLKLVHLTPTNYLNVRATVIDRIGTTHTIDLDTVTFVLQKKVIPARETLKSLLNQGNVNEAVKRIGQIFDLYQSDYEKGIFDRDHNVIDNVGFTKERAMRIDVGKLRFDPKMKQKEFNEKDLQEKVARRLNSWVKRDFPTYHEEIKAYIESRTNS